VDDTGPGVVSFTGQRSGYGNVVEIDHVLVGPTFAVKAGTSAHLDGPGGTADFNIDPAIRTFDAGLAFAGGLEYRRYFFELRYTLGLTDVATDTYPHTDSVKNRSIAIAAGIRFK